MKINPKIWIGSLNTWCEEDWKAVLTCPNCKIGILKMRDEPTAQPDLIDRYVHCDNCGISETFTIGTITICPQCEKPATVMPPVKKLDKKNVEATFKCLNGHIYTKIFRNK